MSKIVLEVFSPEGKKVKMVADELQRAALPLLEYLNKFYGPYHYAIVTEGKVQIVSNETVRVLPIRD